MSLYIDQDGNVMDIEPIHVLGGWIEKHKDSTRWVRLSRNELAQAIPIESWEEYIKNKYKKITVWEYDSICNSTCEKNAMMTRIIMDTLCGRMEGFKEFCEDNKIYEEPVRENSVALAWR